MTADFSRKFAAALRGVMAERGINQKDVAEQLGRSEGFVSARMNGHAAPDMDMADAVAGLTGVDPGDLLDELNRRIRSA